MVFRGPLFEHILLSLQVDDSLATCAVGLSVVTKLLPFAAIQAYDDLKQVLPRLFSILGRTLCWRLSEDRPSQGIRYRDLLDQADEALVQELEQNELEEDKEGAMEHRTPMLHLREGLQWDRLERSDEAIAIVPTRKMYFQILYYLFPVNTVFFLRRTSKYLEDNSLDSPWTVGWEEVLDDLQIRTTSTVSVAPYCKRFASNLSPSGIYGHLLCIPRLFGTTQRRNWRNPTAGQHMMFLE